MCTLHSLGQSASSTGKWAPHRYSLILRFLRLLFPELQGGKNRGESSSGSKLVCGKSLLWSTDERPLSLRCRYDEESFPICKMGFNETACLRSSWDKKACDGIGCWWVWLRVQFAVGGRYVLRRLGAPLPPRSVRILCNTGNGAMRGESRGEAPVCVCACQCAYKSVHLCVGRKQCVYNCVWMCVWLYVCVWLC